MKNKRKINFDYIFAIMLWTGIPISLVSIGILTDYSVVHIHQKIFGFSIIIIWAIFVLVILLINKDKSLLNQINEYDNERQKWLRTHCSYCGQDKLKNYITCNFCGAKY